jgi:hypothetical protein
MRSMETKTMPKLGGVKKNKNDLSVMGPMERRITLNRARDLTECLGRGSAQARRFSGNRHVLLENNLTDLGTCTSAEISLFENAGSRRFGLGFLSFPYPNQR